jgi:hypothetical protein
VLVILIISAQACKGLAAMFVIAYCFPFLVAISVLHAMFVIAYCFPFLVAIMFFSLQFLVAVLAAVEFITKNVVFQYLVRNCSRPFMQH